MSNLKTAKHPKVRPFLEYFSQSLPNVQERNFTRLTWIFKKSSQLQCLLMSLKNRKNASLCTASPPDSKGYLHLCSSSSAKHHTPPRTHYTITKILCLEINIFDFKKCGLEFFICNSTNPFSRVSATKVNSPGDSSNN